MATCYHWGQSKETDCKSITSEIVYRDRNNQDYCALHSPKYYIQPKGFFYGEIDEHSPKSNPVKNEDFKNLLEKFIDFQENNDEIRFDKIYFPKNFSNSIDSRAWPEKRVLFLKCINTPSVSNSSMKSLDFSQCTPSINHIHNCRADRLTASGGNVEGNVIIRDSSFNTITLLDSIIGGTLSIYKIKQLTEEAHYACSVNMRNMEISKNVNIHDLKFDRATSDFRVEDSIFSNDFLYNDNEIKGNIDFKDCSFSSGKVFIENINLSKLKLSLKNLNYLRFINCTYPPSFQKVESVGNSYAEEVYRELKSIAFEQKDYNLVSKWHYLEKEYSLKRNIEEGNTLLVAFLRLYRFISGYGEKPLQAIIVLCGYLFFSLCTVLLISVIHTGISIFPNWTVVKSAIYSLKDFIPFLVVPSKNTLLNLKLSGGLDFSYNLLASFGRVICVLQVAFMSLAIRNKMKR